MLFVDIVLITTSIGHLPKKKKKNTVWNKKLKDANKCSKSKVMKTGLDNYKWDTITRGQSV